MLPDSVGNTIGLRWSMPFYYDSNAVPTTIIDSDVLAKLDDIYTYGIGFSDVVSSIAFPLIIALFAFSFPFIFQIINHINDKYESKLLSKLFATSCQYIIFWSCNVISICYLLIYGMTVLLLPKTELKNLLTTGNWLSIVIASTYAISVLLFVWHCVSFNNPDKLIDIVKKRQKLELRLNKFRKIRLFVKCYVRFLFHRKDDAGNSIYASARKMVSHWSTNAPHEHFVNRLIEIARYAIKRKDTEVFSNVLLSIDKTIEEEKKAINKWEEYDKNKIEIQKAAPHYRTMKFFENLVSIYIPFSNDFIIENSIVYKLLGAFNKSMYMSDADSFRLALCVRNLIDGGNFSLLEKYIDYSRYYFTYIRRLPKVLYIRGGDVSERPKTEKNAQESWDVLCDFHYLVFSYAFASGHYSLLNALLDKNSRWEFNLYPKQSTDILIRYAHCRKNLNRFLVDKLFKHKVDAEDMLDKYTNALLLLLGDSSNECHKASEFITKEVVDDIKSYSKDLKDKTNLIKQNSNLIKLFPQINNTDFSKVYTTCLENIISINNPLLYKEEDINSKQEISCLGKALKIIVKVIKGTNTNSKKRIQINVYTSPLNTKLKQDFNACTKHLMNDVSRHAPMELFSSHKEGKDEDIILKECPLCIYKLCFMYPEFYSKSNLYSTFVELISVRLAYITLSVFRNMDVKDIYVTSADFNIFFEYYTKGCYANFILIDINSPFGTLLNVHFKGWNRFYNGTVPFISIDNAKLSLLSDLDDYKYFEGNLLIVAKKDLPALVDIEDAESISVDYLDNSDEQKKILDIRTTVDIGKKLIYNKKAEVAKITCKQLAL